MNKREERALVSETKALIDEIEGGRFEKVAWIAVQDRVKRLRAAGTPEERTQKSVAALLGKSTMWVRDVIRWDASTSTQSPFSRGSRPGRREGVEDAEAARVARERPGKLAEIIASTDEAERRQIIGALAHDKRTGGEVTQASIGAINEKGEPGGRKRPGRRRGAVDAWGSVVSRTGKAEFQAKECLEEIRAIDEPIPDDLRDDVLPAIETVIGAWELVAATLRGESVGDQAEAFLAEHTEE